MNQEDRPECDVILGFERLGVRFATSVSWRCSPQSVLRMLMRWSVYFKFAQGPPLQCEAVVEGNMIYGRLMTLKQWYPPDREVCLGCHRIGIPDIKKAFLPISSRSVYHAKENNCQTLVVKLLQNLDIPVPHKVCTIASDMKAVFWLRGERVAFNSIVSMVEKAFQCSKKAAADIDLSFASTETEADDLSMCQDCEVRLGFFRIRQSCLVFVASSISARCLMHWSVDLIMSSGPSYRCDAGEEEGVLQGYKRRISPKPLRKDEICVGTFKISTEQIDRVMQRMSDCGSYDPIANNCQTWAVKFMENLKIPVPEDVQTIAHKMDEHFPKCDYNDFKAMVAMLEEKFVDGRPEESTTDM